MELLAIRNVVYIGVDVKTGKKVTSSITAKTLKSLDRKIIQARIDFEAKGSTLKETLLINNFEELAEAWFVSFVTWVTSQNTINRVRSYLDTYLIPKFGEYKPEEIKSADIQIWVNKLAQQSKKSVESGVKKSKKGHAKDFGAVIYKLSDIFDYGITNFELSHNPARTVKIPPKPKVVKERIMVLHGEDLTTWLNYLDTLPDTRANRRFKVICDTLLASALRINELLALTINDLDFDANEIKKRLTELRLPNYGFHLFRHTHASLMLNAGANWKELQIRMGHKSIKTTMDTYAELAPKKKAEAVEIYLKEIAKLTA